MIDKRTITLHSEHMCDQCQCSECLAEGQGDSEISIFVNYISNSIVSEIKNTQPISVKCSDCGNELSYGKFFDPVTDDMSLVVNKCECEG